MSHACWVLVCSVGVIISDCSVSMLLLFMSIYCGLPGSVSAIIFWSSKLCEVVHSAGQLLFLGIYTERQQNFLCWDKSVPLQRVPESEQLDCQESLMVFLDVNPRQSLRIGINVMPRVCTYSK